MDENAKAAIALLADPTLSREIYENLIAYVSIPPVSPNENRPKSEVLFSSSLIGLFVVQCWRFGLGDRVRMVLAEVVKMIPDSIVRIFPKFSLKLIQF